MSWPLKSDRSATGQPKFEFGRCFAAKRWGGWGYGDPTPVGPPSLLQPARGTHCLRASGFLSWKPRATPGVTRCCCFPVTRLWLTLCNPTDCSTPGFPVLHYLPALTQTTVHWVRDAINRLIPLPSPSPPAFTLSQHQGLFQWAGSSHQVAKVLELQLQHQSFQWIFKVDFL